MPELAALHPILIYRREIVDICRYRVRVREFDTTPILLEVPPVAAHHRQIASLYYSSWFFLCYFLSNPNISLDLLISPKMKTMFVFYYSINHLVWAALEMVSPLVKIITQFSISHLSFHSLLKKFFLSTNLLLFFFSSILSEAQHNFLFL